MIAINMWGCLGISNSKVEIEKFIKQNWVENCVVDPTVVCGTNWECFWEKERERAWWRQRATENQHDTLIKQTFLIEKSKRPRRGGQKCMQEWWVERCWDVCFRHLNIISKTVFLKDHCWVLYHHPQAKSFMNHTLERKARMKEGTSCWKLARGSQHVGLDPLGSRSQCL